MLLPEPKKAATIIVSKMHRDGSEDHAEAKPEEEVGEHDAELKAIAEDMLRAFHGGSAHDLMIALKAFMECVEEADEEQDAQMME